MLICDVPYRKCIRRRKGKQQSSSINKLGNMSKETNSEELFILPKSFQKSDVKRHVKDNDERMTTTIEDLTKQFVKKFNFFQSKKRKGRKYNALHKEEIMTNGVILNVLSSKEIEDVTSFSEEDEKGSHTSNKEPCCDR
jgi:predicted transcriptional regulator